jgi:hypothetical protein
VGRLIGQARRHFPAQVETTARPPRHVFVLGAGGAALCLLTFVALVLRRRSL